MKTASNSTKNLIYGIVLCCICFLTGISCSKSATESNNDDNHPLDTADTTYPVITIDRPVANQAYANGDTIKIEGKVTDNGLYRGKIKITNDLNGLVVNDQSYEVHFLQSYNFSFFHKAAVTVASDYTISVEFEDHGLNTTSRIVKVKVNP